MFDFVFLFWTFFIGCVSDGIFDEELCNFKRFILDFSRMFKFRRKLSFMLLITCRSRSFQFLLCLNSSRRKLKFWLLMLMHSSFLFSQLFIKLLQYLSNWHLLIFGLLYCLWYINLCSKILSWKHYGFWIRFRFL